MIDGLAKAESRMPTTGCSADVAQLVEHSLGKGEVTSSILVIGSSFVAQVAEWLMAADCKSAALWSYGGSNPPLCTSNY